MPGTLRADFLELLRTLGKHGVDFILVGGVAAAVQGAPIMTFDVDVLYATDAPNLPRLLIAIEDLEGYYRIQPERRLKPQLSHLASGGHNLLATASVRWTCWAASGIRIPFWTYCHTPLRWSWAGVHPFEF